MAVLAREFAGLVLADTPHQRLRKRFGVAGMTGHADLLTDESRFNHGAYWLPRGHRRGSRRRWRAVAAKKILQRVNRVVSLGEFQTRFMRNRLPCADTLCEFIELGIDRVIRLTGRRC